MRVSVEPMESIVNMQVTVTAKVRTEYEPAITDRLPEDCSPGSSDSEIVPNTIEVTVSYTDEGGSQVGDEETVINWMDNPQMHKVVTAALKGMIENV